MEETGFGVIAFIIIALLAVGWDAVSCSSQTKGIGFEHKWDPISGCMIKKDDRWIPLDNYRSI